MAARRRSSPPAGVWRGPWSARGDLRAAPLARPATNRRWTTSRTRSRQWFVRERPGCIRWPGRSRTEQHLRHRPVPRARCSRPGEANGAASQMIRAGRDPQDGHRQRDRSAIDGAYRAGVSKSAGRRAVRVRVPVPVPSSARSRLLTRRHSFRRTPCLLRSSPGTRRFARGVRRASRGPSPVPSASSSRAWRSPSL